MTDPMVFALTVLAILVTPGPTNTLLAMGGAATGVRKAVPLVVAEALGYGIAIIAIGLAAKPVLARSPAVTVPLRLMVAGYLLVLAYRLWRRGRVIAEAADVITPSRVFVTTLLNPKAFVFAVGVIPFGAASVGGYLLGFFGILIPVSASWIAFGATVGRLAAMAGREHWFVRLGAAMLIVFAGLLLATAAAT